MKFTEITSLSNTIFVEEIPNEIGLFYELRSLKGALEDRVYPRGEFEYTEFAIGKPLSATHFLRVFDEECEECGAGPLMLEHDTARRPKYKALTKAAKRAIYTDDDIDDINKDYYAEKEEI